MIIQDMDERVKVSDADVLRMLHRWRSRLGLPEQWHFSVSVNHDRNGVSKKLRKLDGQVSIRHGYFLAEFTFNVFNHTTLKELEETVVHELLHVALSPLVKLTELNGGKRWRKVVTHTEESVVTVLSKALVKR